MDQPPAATREQDPCEFDSGVGNTRDYGICSHAETTYQRYPAATEKTQALVRSGRSRFGQVEFAEVRTVVFAAHHEGAYQQGLDAIGGCETNDEAEQTDLAFWKMCLLSRLARLEEACEVFARSLELNRWWGPAMLADPDFQNVREVPDWIRLSEESQLRARHAGQASPLPIDLVPDTEVRATLVLLHGAGAVPRAIAEMRIRCQAGIQGYRLLRR